MAVPMVPARRKRIQNLYVDLLDNIAPHHYQSIISELFAREVLSSVLKKKILSKQGDDQLREVLDVLPTRGNAAFDVFYEVLVKYEEDIAADLLCPERAEERKSKRTTESAGVQEPQHHVPEPEGDELPESVQVTQHDVPEPEDDELPEKWPDYKAHEPMKVAVTNVADSDVQMRELFWKAQSDKSMWYAMHQPVRGIFLLIANTDFADAIDNGVKLANRDGTASDVIALKSLFKQLGFRVKEKFNCSADEMLKAIQQQASLDHTSYNCFACAVLTHGEQGALYGVDGKLLPVDDFKNAIDGDRCSSLVGKPKLFFIQACQGGTHDPGVGFAGAGAAGPEPSNSADKQTEQMADKMSSLSMQGEEKCDSPSNVRLSAKSDMYTAMATLPDYVSWRHTAFGTWFIQAIAYVFSRFAHKYTLEQLMIRVNRLVSKAETSEGMKQVPISSSPMLSELYFFPGLPVTET